MPSMSADNVEEISSTLAEFAAWNGAMTRVRATYASLNAISAAAAGSGYRRIQRKFSG